MRALLMTAAVAALVSCSPPEHDAEAPQQPERSTVEACNNVAPNPAMQVAVQEALAVAAAASELRGGPIVPGTYDLASAQRVGAARGWEGTRAVALEITESADGPLTFNWASAAADRAMDTWTATFTDVAQQGQLTYTCGRMGEVLGGFAAEGNTLQLRIPDGAGGSLDLTFTRRSS